MKRREFVKTIPVVALATTAASCGTEDAKKAIAPATAPGPQSSNGSPKSFSVANPNLDDPGVHDFVHCDQFGIDAEGSSKGVNAAWTVFKVREYLELHSRHHRRSELRLTAKPVDGVGLSALGHRLA